MNFSFTKNPESDFFIKHPNLTKTRQSLKVINAPWLSLVLSMMVSFCAVLFPTRCLG